MTLVASYLHSQWNAMFAGHRCNEVGEAFPFTGSSWEAAEVERLKGEDGLAWSSKSVCTLPDAMLSPPSTDDGGSDTPRNGAEVFEYKSYKGDAANSTGPSLSSPSAPALSHRSASRNAFPSRAVDMAFSNSTHSQETGAPGLVCHDHAEVHSESSAVEKGGSRKRIASEHLFSHAVRGRLHLDLSGKVTVDMSFRPAQGGYADVFRGHYPIDGEVVPVAIKRLRIHAGANSDVFKNFAKEIRVWARLSHPNVLPLLGYMMEGDYPSLVSKWMINGSLKLYMTVLSTRELFVMAVGIAKGLYYLHSNNVIHSDLKTDNVLVSDTGAPLLTDFGISRLESTSTTGYNTESVKGSTRWMAYEFFQISDNDEEPPPTHTEKTDVWSYGMTVLELITGNVPYASIKNDLQVMFAIVGGQLPSEPSFSGSHADVTSKRSMWSICQKCWIKNPDNRPSIAGLLREMEAYLHS